MSSLVVFSLALTSSRPSVGAKYIGVMPLNSIHSRPGTTNLKDCTRMLNFILKSNCRNHFRNDIGLTKFGYFKVPTASVVATDAIASYE